MLHVNLNLKTLVLLAVTLCATFAAAAFAVLAPGNATKPFFTMKARTDRSTIAPGATVRYKVTLRHRDGFRKPVRLGMRGLPQRVRVVWRLADGRTLPRAKKNRKGGRYRHAAILPARRTTAYAVVTTTRSARGLYTPTLTATRRGIKRRRVMRLRFSTRRPAERQLRAPLIVASPANRTVLQGDVTSYDIDVDPGDVGALDRFSAQGLPDGATATFTPPPPGGSGSAVMSVETRRSTPVGSYDLAISATNGAHTARAATTLTVAETKNFTIRGDAPTPLSPGVTAPIAVRFDNPYAFPLRLTRLHITAGASSPACDATENFAVRQVTLDRPLALPPGPSTLNELPSGDLIGPALTMRNLPTNQDACKNTPIRLTYSGLAGK